MSDRAAAYDARSLARANEAQIYRRSSLDAGARGGHNNNEEFLAPRNPKHPKGKDQIAPGYERISKS